MFHKLTVLSLLTFFLQNTAHHQVSPCIQSTEENSPSAEKHGQVPVVSNSGRDSLPAFKLGPTSRSGKNPELTEFEGPQYDVDFANPVIPFCYSVSFNSSPAIISIHLSIALPFGLILYTYLVHPNYFCYWNPKAQCQTKPNLVSHKTYRRLVNKFD